MSSSYSAPPSPAQSGQQDDDDNRRIDDDVDGNDAEADANSRNDPEEEEFPADSNPQPGPSQSVDDVVHNPQPGSSSSSSAEVSGSSSSLFIRGSYSSHLNNPDDGSSNSQDFWASSSGGGRGGDDGTGGGGEASAPLSRSATSASSRGIDDDDDDEMDDLDELGGVDGGNDGVVGAEDSSLDTQRRGGNSNNNPSSSGFLSGSNPGPSQSSSFQRASAALLQTSSSSGAVIGSSASDAMRSAREGAVGDSGQNDNNPLASCSSSSTSNGGRLLRSSYPVAPDLPGSISTSSGIVIHSQHGEISNPPSPLGGSQASGSIRPRGECPDSPLPGPSSFGRRKVQPLMVAAQQQQQLQQHQPHQQNQPGPSGLQFGSSEATAAGNRDSPMASPPNSPAVRNPILFQQQQQQQQQQQPILGQQPPPHFIPMNLRAGQENQIISSSSGVGSRGQSVQSAPVDIHSDNNDLSVPSPNPAPLRAATRARNVMDDMIDSTVDSSGLPFQSSYEQQRQQDQQSGFCQSSRYLDSSDDDDEDDESDRGPHPQGSEAHAIVANRDDRQQDDEEDNISTSGQIDEGQFRLVPNNPEDDIFNRHHPPLRKAGPGGKGVKNKSNAASFAPSSSSSSSTSASIYSNPQPGTSAGDLIPKSTSKPAQAQHDEEEMQLNLVDFGQAEAGPSREVSEPLLPDIQLDNYGSHNGLVDPPLPSSFHAIDPVDLEDIQLQKFVPETQQQQVTSAPSSSSATTSTASSSSTAATSSSSSSVSKPLLLVPEIDLSSLKPSGSQGDGGNGSDSFLQPSTSTSSTSATRSNGGSGMGGAAFTGIPPSFVEDASGASSSMSNEANNNSQQQQHHSSILESMTGPLSKRLRTLHTLQQRQSESAPNDPDTSDDGPKGKKRKRSSGGRENSDSNGGPSGLNHDSDSNHSNGNGGNGGAESSSSFLGGTHQSYNVMLETVNSGVVEALKQKGSDASDFSLPWENLTKEIAALPPVQTPLSSSKRPKRTPLKKDPLLSSSPDLLLISDAPVQSRARASLPSSHLAIREVKSSDCGELGVFAKKKILKSSRFGPVEGVKKPFSSNRSEMKDESLSLIVKTLDGNFEIDVSDEEQSNWMRFVRPANSPSEQNLSLAQDGDQLYFTANRTIKPRQELRVSYAPDYAKERHIEIDETAEDEEHDDENLWPCYECNKKLNSSEEFQAHLNEHDKQGRKSGRRTSTATCAAASSSSSSQSVGQRKKMKVLLPEKTREFSCPICSKEFSKEQSLNRHVELHRNEKSFTCDECGSKFSHELTLSRHKRKVHSTDPEGKCTRCPKCGLWFASDSVYRVHLFGHHPDKSRQNLTVEEALAQGKREESVRQGEEMKFQCPECESQFDNWLDLVQHVDVHGLPRLERVEIGEDEPNEEEIIGNKHKCELCYKTFATEERLSRHMAVHGTEELKPLPCNDCGKRFLTNSALAGHAKIHSVQNQTQKSGSYDCPICGQIFSHVVNLKEHVHIHCINGQYGCPHCSKSFPEYSLIRKHIRAFHGEKKHICQHCSKSFASADKLKIHVLIHSDVKEFLCNDCGKQFRRKDKLREHVLRMHAARNEDQNAAASQVKQQKLRTKDKFVPKVSPNDYHRFIYKCHDCLLGFKRRGMLVNHLAKRHPDVSPDSVPELNLPILKTTKDYYCQYCTKVYKSSSKRKAHIIKNHPGQALPLQERILRTEQSGANENGSPRMIASAAAALPRANETFSATVGSVTSQPHRCPFCHKQYASNAKLLQHQRKKHMEQLPLDKQIPRGNAGNRGRSESGNNNLIPHGNELIDANLESVDVIVGEQRISVVVAKDAHNEDGLERLCIDENIELPAAAIEDDQSSNSVVFATKSGGGGVNAAYAVNPQHLLKGEGLEQVPIDYHVYDAGLPSTSSGGGGRQHPLFSPSTAAPIILRSPIDKDGKAKE